jgi:hypothetical protein
MTDDDFTHYARSACTLLGLNLAAADHAAVAAHLARNAQIAQLLGAVALSAADEPAEIYRPAPFVQPTPQAT